MKNAIKINFIPDDYLNKIYVKNAIDFVKSLPDNCLDCVTTSPPYFGLRSYLKDGDENKIFEIGSEETLSQYIENLVLLFSEIKRVLKPTGTLWVNLDDAYGRGKRVLAPNDGYRKDNLKRTGKYEKHTLGYGKPKQIQKNKSLLLIPQRFVIAMSDDGWYVRNEIIWAKTNSRPESMNDRLTRSYEKIFLFTKSEKYYFDWLAIAQPYSDVSVARNNRSVSNNTKYSNGIPIQGKQSLFKSRKAGELEEKMKNIPMVDGKYMARRKDIWEIATSNYRGAHFAGYPVELVKTMIMAGCPKNGIVYDPFMGSGTTAIAALEFGCNYVGTDLNAEYVDMANNRIEEHVLRPIKKTYNKKIKKQQDMTQTLTQQYQLTLFD